MVKFVRSLLLFTFILLVIPFSYAATLTVDQNNVACNALNGTPTYCTIQDAVNNATSGDRIRVLNGTYTETVNVSADVYLEGLGYQLTVVDCQGATNGIRILGSDVSIEGFHFTGCTNGIDVLDADSRIVNNSFSGNTKGIRFKDAPSAFVSLNSFIGNSAFGIKNVDPDVVVDVRNNYWGACDGPSGFGDGSGDAVSDNATFEPWIGICVQNKMQSPLCSFEFENITLSAFLNSSSPIDTAVLTYSANGSNFSKMMVPFNGRYEAQVLSSEIQVGQNVTWNVLVTDIYGFNFTNGLQMFSVLGNTVLTVNPALPDGLANWYVTEPEFSLAPYPGGDARYSWEDDVVHNYLAPFMLEDIPNQPVASAGTVGLDYFSSFSCGNESVMREIFYVDLLDPVVSPLGIANGSILYNAFEPNISFHLDDTYQSNSGINLSTLVFLVDGMNQTPEIYSHNNGHDVDIWFVPDPLSEGTHIVTVFVQDNAGRNGSYQLFFDVMSTTAFTLDVNSPLSGVSGSRRALFDIDTNISLYRLEFMNLNNQRPRNRLLCRNCDSYSRNQILAEGWNNITIKATDMFGTVISEVREVFVDSIKPRITRTFPRRNSVFNGTGFVVKYREVNLDSVVLIVGGTEYPLVCSAGQNEECSIDADISGYEGLAVDYYFEINDSVHSVESRKTGIVVDTVDPVISVVAPAHNETYVRRVPFNITVSEEVTLEYMDVSDRNPRWKRLCSRCDEIGTAKAKLRSFRRGDHELIVRARDNAGQTDEVYVNVTVV